MRRTAANRALDLAVVLALALVALAALLLPLPDTARALLVWPLVLVLPGYAAAAAIFRPATIDAGLRTVLVVALSIGVTSLGGLALQTRIDLDAKVYAALLLVVTFACVGVALRRRATAPSLLPTPIRLPRVGLAPLAGFAAALVLSGGAIAVATQGEHRQLDSETFTAMWILPRGTGSEFSAAIGVQNTEESARSYDLRVSQGGRLLRRWRLRLQPGDRWHGGVPASAIASRAPVVAALFVRNRLYRRVALHPGAEA